MVEAVVRVALEGAEDTELEARVGVMDGHTFHAGIDAPTFDAINDVLGSYQPWAARSETSRHDFFLGKRRLTSSPDMLRPLCIQKMKLAAHVEPLHDHHRRAIRVAAAREIPCNDDCVNSAFTSATFVRIKEILSWTTKSGFSYDLSRVWEGSSLSVAMKKRHEEEPKFEFEIELTDRAYLKKHGYAYTAKSLLMKMNDVIVAANDHQQRRC